MTQTPSNNVIGPFDAADWITLKMLRESLKHMRTTDPTRYEIAIRKEAAIYADILGGYLTPANDNLPQAQAA